MKKLLTIIALSLLVVGFGSCKKDFVCECTINYPAMAGIPSTTSTNFINDTKRKAKRNCENQSTAFTIAGFTVSQDCRLQ